MKAIRVHQFGGPEVLSCEDIAEPQVGAGQVLVGLHAIGINPVETYLRSGSNPSLPLPYTPGTDAAGVVTALGEDVTGLRLGDRVYTSGSLTGTYAQSALCSAKTVHPLPENVTFEQGAALGIPYATALRALRQRAAAQGGETVLIHGGSGGVGLAAIQIARCMGLRVIATAGTEEGLNLVIQQGAHIALNHRGPDYLTALPSLTDGKGPDIILEMLSNINLAADAQIIAKRGRIIVIGCRGKIEMNPRDLMIREADVRGLLLFNCTEAELATLHAEIGDELIKGTYQPVISRHFALSEAPSAHAAVMQSSTLGKLILLPEN